MSKTLIIGGVAGGATAAARMRRIDEDMEIIILERGDYISYANCGLPYYIGDVIKDREALLVQTPEGMKKKYNIDVRVGNEAVKINPETKKVVVKTKDGETYEETYDDLLIATGSSPLKPPIPGIDGEGIYTLWNVNDTDKIRSIVDKEIPKTAAVIGGGFIGLEMAENLHKRGIYVTLIEAQDQVMAPVDFEMAQMLHENMRDNGVDLRLGDGVSKFERVNNKTKITLSKGDEVYVDLVILSIGVKPNSDIAKEAGIEVNQKGGIITDKTLKTSQPNIWAVGDVIEVENLVTKEGVMIPLAGPANKQGRMVAGNIVKTRGEGKLKGELEEYDGSLGTAVAQVFDLTVATVGINEKYLQSKDQKKEEDYYTVVITQKSHAGYYPMATPLTLKVIFEKEGRLLGAQCVGQDGVDKRVDIIATAMRFGATIYDLKKLELAYAPPYSSAKDPVNMAGFVGENILNGLIRFKSPRDLDKENKEDKVTVVDVMEDVERAMWAMDKSQHIPLGQLRERFEELPKDKPICTYCAIGVRSYNGARLLMAKGFKDVTVLEAGTGFYKSSISQAAPRAKNESSKEEYMNGDSKEGGCNLTGDVRILDCCGLQCPGPIMKVNEALKAMEEGETMRVSATDMGFGKDVKSWCKRTGNTFLGMTREGKENIVTIRKGIDSGDSKGTTKDIENLQCHNKNQVASPDNQGKTIIVFDGDLDKVLASFIIANGAAAMGRPVTMFFTFWGLNVLRKSEHVKVEKTFVEKMFGKMMPRGTGKLKLSNMNMGGMGTKMMKAVMKEKNVSSLEDLMAAAMANGVKLVACTMSMDVMGIKEEELIDGVELAGVATYLGDAELSNVNLFI